MTDNSSGTLQIAGAVMTGRHHLGSGLVVGKNCQDGAYWEQSGDLAVAVVCDGNGSHEHSEVGAKLGARLIANTVLAQFTRIFAGAQPDGKLHKLPATFWRRVERDVCAQLRVLALSLTTPGKSLTKTFEDYFLFTVVGAVVSPLGVTVFSVGDGYYAINGQLTELGPYPKPPYLAFQLYETEDFHDKPELTQLAVRAEIPYGELDSLLLASDGLRFVISNEHALLPGKTDPKKDTVGAVSQFWMNDDFFKGPVNLRRRLVLMNSERTTINRQGKEAQLIVHPGLLMDDLSLVVIRRR